MKRSWLTAFLTAALLASGYVTAVRAEGPVPNGAIALDVGNTVFWDGPMIELAGLGSDDGSGNFTTNPGLGALKVNQCSPAVEAIADRSDCFDYFIDVAAGGGELRVAVEHPSNFDSIGIVLVDPDGDVAASDTGEALTALPGQNLYSAEVIVASPSPGRWRATVVANDVRRSAFRMRAALRGAHTPPPAQPVRLLPNLQASPPFQVGFGPCLDAEREAYGAQRCLRLTQGPANVGDGPLELVVETVGEPGQDANGQDTLIGTQHQLIHYSDGSTEKVEAGSFHYHLAHAHYHHSQTGNLELLRVTNRGNGGLQPAGRGPKQGFCMGDYFIAEWDRVASGPRRTDAGYLGRPNCGVPTPGISQMQLSTGWGDVYPRGVEGQFVEFAGNADGLYVVRAAVNPDGAIHESNYEDNVSYAYIRVCGDVVDVIERGLGTDPWDRSKLVVDDGRQVTMEAAKTYPAPPLADDRPCPNR